VRCSTGSCDGTGRCVAPLPAGVEVALDAPAAFSSAPSACVRTEAGAVHCEGVGRVRDAGAVQLVAGAGFRCERLLGGGVACAGRNDLGQLGRGFTSSLTEPAGSVPLPGPARSVAAAESSACALLEDGRVVCWGQLAYLPSTSRPAVMPKLADVRALFAGDYAYCAIDGAGVAWCWGAFAATPFAITDGAGAPILAVAAAPTFDSVSLLRPDGGVVTSFLYAGAVYDARELFLPGVVELVAGASATCARSASGEVECRELRAYGGDFSWGAGPVGAGPGAEVVGLVMRGASAGALLADGSVSVWTSSASRWVGP
jgi:hypothetical protein